jgi:hypothetical protein
MMTYELDGVERRVLAGGGETRHRHSYQTIEGQSVPQCTCGDVRNYDDGIRDRLLAGVRDVGRVASIATIKAALLDTIDAGCHHDDGMSHEWKFNAAEESFANEQRCAFVDRVAERVAQLQATPHLYDEKLLAKLNDAKAEYNRGYRDGWEDRVLDEEEMRQRALEGKR